MCTIDAMSFNPLRAGSFLPAKSVTDRNMADFAITNSAIATSAIDNRTIQSLAIDNRTIEDDAITNRNIANASISPSKLTYLLRSLDITGTWSMLGSRKVVDHVTGIVTIASVNTIYVISTDDFSAFVMNPIAGTDTASSGYKIASPFSHYDTSGNQITQLFIANGKVYMDEDFTTSSPTNVQSNMEIIPKDWDPDTQKPVEMVYSRMSTEPFTVNGNPSSMVESGVIIPAIL
jgi:hypothetical protein